jgi:hypothetical protein
MQSGELSQLMEAGNQLLGTSPDYKQLLVSSGSNLSIVQPDGESTLEISADLYANSTSGAVWDQETNQIHYLAEENNGTALYRYDVDSGSDKFITSSNPVLLLTSSNGTVVWVQGSCNSLGDCKYKSLHWFDSSDHQSYSREISDTILLPCQAATEFIYAERDNSGGLSFHIQALENEDETIFWALNTEYSDCAWSPDHQEVAVTLIDRGWYSGVIQEHHLQILNPERQQVRDLSYVHDLVDQIAWSPDGSYLALSGTAGSEGNYQLSLGVLELETLKVTRHDQLTSFQSENYLSINHIFWLP